MLNIEITALETLPVIEVEEIDVEEYLVSIIDIHLDRYMKIENSKSDKINLYAYNDV